MKGAAMKTLKIAVIGCGWIGTSHARALNNIKMCYGTDIVPELDLVVDAIENSAKSVCERYGFNRWSTNADDAFNDPQIDIVFITTPNQLHVQQVEKAAAAGKAIFCEKPLGMDGADAKKALEAVKKYDTTSMVGFVYTQNPAVVEAKKIIDNGLIGDIIAFQGRYDMEYSADPQIPHRWRDYDAISGALGDIGAHIIALQNFVTGSKITEVVGRGKTIYDKRPNAAKAGEMLPVTNDDIFNIMYNTDTDIMGMITTSRVAKGEKVGIRFEVQGTKGYIRFDQERMNELEVYIDGDAETTGCSRILMGPQHGQFGDVCTTQGLNASWVDLMTIQDFKLLKAVADGTKVKPDIESGYEINVLIDALLLSVKEHRWVKVAECE